ncbi:unnamed protein product [Schistocephalus solidus]|uniref:Uncharacterized protein n=1 Tax=Schistocephalus solidus TaxID=70667 RepID=A0A183TI86_SCHSO|nr:unnamed protein product [Schistocephalus solidus]
MGGYQGKFILPSHSELVIVQSLANLLAGFANDSLSASIVSSLCDCSRELWTSDSTDSTRTLTVVTAAATAASGLSTAASAPATVSQSRASVRVRSRRLTNYDAKLIASVDAAAPINNYFLRNRKPKALTRPAAAAAPPTDSPHRSPHQSACFYLDSPTSTSSSATCPAVDPECVPPRDRLVLVCKRSRTGSTDLSSPLSHASPEAEWFVERSPPPLLHVTSLYRPMSTPAACNKRRHSHHQHYHHHLHKRARTLLPTTHSGFDPQTGRCLSGSRSSSSSRALMEDDEGAEGASPFTCDFEQSERQTASLTGLPRASSQSSCLTYYSLASPIVGEEHASVRRTTAATQFELSPFVPNGCPPVRSYHASSSLRCPTPVVLCRPTQQRHKYTPSRSSVIFGTGACSSPASSARKTFLLRSQLGRQARDMWTTAVTTCSSLLNTPSPPHLQPALTPPPPILQEPDCFPCGDSSGGSRCLFASSSSSPITAPECSSCPPLYPDGPDSPSSINPGLEQHQGSMRDLHLCLNGSSSSSNTSPSDLAALRIKPLTVTIKRLGQKLYCVSGYEAEETVAAVEQGQETAFLESHRH